MSAKPIVSLCTVTCIKVIYDVSSKEEIKLHEFSSFKLNNNIDEFSYRAWHFITSFIDYAIKIYVGQKAREN